MSLEANVSLQLGKLSLDAEIHVPTGEVVAVLGPNGSGKTTLLRALAGLLPLGEGRVILDGQVLEDRARGLRLPAENRPIGFVFQDYLLFPHLSALENVAFGLRARGRSKAEARATAQEWLERVGLAEHSRSKPGALSGGQAQRVALARALAIDPRLLLLDEPLAALDAGARVGLRRVLKKHLASFAGTRLLVTHSPLEAAALADRLIVLENGRVIQEGRPSQVTQHPRSSYVAELVGLNLIRGKADGDHIELEGGGRLVVPGAGRGEVFAAIHPRAVALHRARPEGSPRNVWEGIVAGLDDEGDRARVSIGGLVPIVAEVTAAATSDLDLASGGPIWVSVKATEVAV
jgi:molybdate transport system ATP-binding protein